MKLGKYLNDGLKILTDDQRTAFNDILSTTEYTTLIKILKTKYGRLEVLEHDPDIYDTLEDYIIDIVSSYFETNKNRLLRRKEAFNASYDMLTTVEHDTEITSNGSTFSDTSNKESAFDSVSLKEVNSSHGEGESTGNSTSHSTGRNGPAQDIIEKELRLSDRIEYINPIAYDLHTLILIQVWED